ncbi:MAG: penicillin-binding protein, partial [Clostridia bacterium]|nr:penicillin-binding protein [Clostridia bacterium]
MKQPSKAKKVLKITILSLFVVLVAGIFVVGGMFFYLYNTTHLDINAISQNNLGVSIYDNSGKMLSQSVNSSKRLVDVNELPQYVLDAFTSIEDKNFYTHNGIEPYRIAKAMLVNIINKDKVQGASTITQQLIKNTLLSAEKTYSRKAKEIVLALKLENNMSKDQIMQEYLNTIYFGENCYGIENASEHYFGVRAKNLTLSQAATLAGMINAPSIYSPTNAKDKTMSRRNLVLKTMLALNKTTQAEYNEAISQDLVVLDNPHNFVNSYTRASIIETCDILDLTEKEFIRGQYKIYTYIDPEIQSSLESNLSK